MATPLPFVRRESPARAEGFEKFVLFAPRGRRREFCWRVIAVVGVVATTVTSELHVHCTAV